MSTMKAVTVYGPGDGRMEAVPKPEATGDMVVIRVLRTGVCATDFSIYTGESSFIRSGEIVFPCRFGHEFAGVVEAVGPEVTAFAVGDRVYADNYVSCGVCPACKEGRYADCGEVRSVGTVNCWDGCYAEYMQMPQRHVYRLPEELSMDEGALIEPASIAYDAFNGVRLTKQDTAVVFGTGAIGMCAVWLAKYYGAGQVILVGRTPAKLEVGRQVGADVVINNRQTDAVAQIKALTDGKGAQLLIETSGAPSALKQCIAAARRDARISIVSFYEQTLDGMPIDPVVLGRMTIAGAAGRPGNAPAVCRIMAQYPVKLTPIISHHVSFDACLDVFQNEEKYHDTKIKVMIDFD